MTGPTPDIRTEWTVDADPAVKSLNELAQAFREAGKRQDELEKGGRKAKDTYGGLTRTLADVATALGVAKLGDYVKQQVAAADAVGKLAQKTGVAVETLSVFGIAGLKAGQSLQDLETDFNRLSKAAEELQRGSPDTVRAFRTIGLSAKDLEGLAPDQVFLRIASAQERYADGTAKLDAIQRIFGRNASQVLPLLHDLADDGFDRARDRAEKLGLVLDEETTRAAAEAADQFDELKSQASILALTFANEVLPSLTSAGKSLAEFVGKLDPATKRLLINVTAVSAGILGLSSVASIARFALAPLFGLLAANPAVGGALITLGLIATALATLTRNAEDARRSYSGFVDALNKTTDPKVLTTQELALGDRLLEIYDELDKLRGSQKPEDKTKIDLLNAELRLIVAQTAALRRRRRELEGAPKQTTPNVPDPELLKAQAAAQQQAAEDQLKREQARLKERQQAEDDAFSVGLIGVGKYYDERRKLARRGTAAEIAALQAQRRAIEATPLANANDPAEQARRATALATVDAQLFAKRVEGRTEIAKLDIEERDRQIQLATDRLQYEREIQQAKGNTLTIALSGIENEAAEFDKLMRQEGAGLEERQRKLKEFRDSLTQQAVFTTNANDAARQFQDLGRIREALQNQADRGLISQRQVEERLADIENARLPALREMAKQAMDLAQQLGNPELIAQAAYLNQQVENIAASADLAARRTAELIQSLQQGVASDFTNFLTAVGTDITQIGTEVVNLIQSLAQSVVQTFAQRFGDDIAESLINGIRKGSEQVSAATSAVKLTASAVAVDAAGTKLDGAGNKVIAAGGTILAAASSLSRAADKLLIAAIAAKSSGNGDSGFSASDAVDIGVQIASFAKFGFAEGGVVPGSGGGDTVHAMLTPGEGILNRREMAAIGGADGFAALRNLIASTGGRTPPIRRSGIDHYAGGGIVRAAPAPGGSEATIKGHVLLELGEGLVASYLESDEGTDQVIKIQQRRRPDVLAALELG